MGTVYRARDTRLNRQVAIKTLSDTYALTPDRVARFEREAQLLAALNHPHIAGI
jgi:serine/threonine protein kinase